jgi:bacillithiol biosynthesis cysteine-adding enzyme BshC
VPGFSRTWLSIVSRSADAADLYARQPADLDACRAAANETLSRSRDYKKLADILFEEAKRYGVPAETTKRLALLAEGRALVVVTGQQVGYLGGPFFTFLKAYHCTRLARALEASLKIPVLPVFWLEGEDHDLEEVRASNYPANDGTIKSVTFKPAREIQNVEVGRYELGDQALEHIHQLASELTPVNMQGAELLESAYRNGNLSGAMGKLLASLLGGRGLFVIEGMHPELKKSAQPLWKHVIEIGPKLAQIFDARAAELKSKGWPVPMSPTPDSYLFYVTDKNHVRMAVSYDGAIKHPDGKTEKVTKDELLSRIESGEYGISPKAALRPLYQDYVLPNIAYIGGQGELEYHAQLAPFYRELNVPAPSLFPRLSVTLLDSKIERLLEKTALSIETLMSEPEHVLIKKLIRTEDEGNTAELFVHARRQIEMIYERIKSVIGELDPTLAGAAQSSIGKSLHPLEQLEQKTAKALKQQHATALARLERILAALKPNGKLTERAYGTAYYLLKYGPLPLLEILDSLPGDVAAHPIVTVD